MLDTRRMKMNKDYISCFYKDNRESAYSIKGCTDKVIDKAIQVYCNCGGYDGEYLFDTVDRERIRFIIEALLGMDTQPLL